jgi:hypothetical protein
VDGALGDRPYQQRFTNVLLALRGLEAGPEPRTAR